MYALPLREVGMVQNRFDGFVAPVHKLKEDRVRGRKRPIHLVTEAVEKALAAIPRSSDGDIFGQRASSHRLGQEVGAHSISRGLVLFTLSLCRRGYALMMGGNVVAYFGRAGIELEGARLIHGRLPR